jgi:hypothetical protein
VCGLLAAPVHLAAHEDDVDPQGEEARPSVAQVEAPNKARTARSTCRSTAPRSSLSIPDMGLRSGDTTLPLYGTLRNGVPFIGADTIRVLK